MTTRIGVVAVQCLSALYAVGFVIYLAGLYNLLWAAGPPVLGVLVLLGGTILVTLHAVSDVGIIGLLGSKLGGPLGPSDDPSVAHTLYLMTFAVDSIGDVFGSLFAAATGLLVLRSGLLPRWLGWASIVAGALFFLQGLHPGRGDRHGWGVG